MKKLIFIAMLSGTAAFAQAPQFQGNSKSAAPIHAFNAKVRIISGDTYNQFSDTLQELTTELSKEADPAKRYNIFAEASAALHAIKRNGKRPDDEVQAVEMALVLETFNHMPLKRDFKVEKCQEEFERTRNRMENKTADIPEDPGVEKALQILALVCGTALTS